MINDQGKPNPRLFYCNSTHASNIKNFFASQPQIKYIKEPIAFACVLGNDKILAACYSKLIVYDKDFKEIRRIDQINMKEFFCESVAVNEHGQIYICNSVEKIQSSIILVDNNFFFIKSYVMDGKFTSICYRNGFLYACNMDRKQIIVLDKHFSSAKTRALLYKPSTILANNDTICVRNMDVKDAKFDCFLTKFHFYDVNSLELKNSTKNYSGFYISTELDSFFYTFNPKQMVMRSHTDDGIFIELINLPRSDKLNAAKCFFCIDKKLYIVQSEAEENSSIVFSY